MISGEKTHYGTRRGNKKSILKYRNFTAPKAPENVYLVDFAVLPPPPNEFGFSGQKYCQSHTSASYPCLKPEYSRCVENIFSTGLELFLFEGRFVETHAGKLHYR